MNLGKHWLTRDHVEYVKVPHIPGMAAIFKECGMPGFCSSVWLTCFMHNILESKQTQFHSTAGNTFT